MSTNTTRSLSQCSPSIFQWLISPLLFLPTAINYQKPFYAQLQALSPPPSSLAMATSPSATKVQDFATTAPTSPQNLTHPPFSGDLHIDTQSHTHGRDRGRSVGSTTATGAQVDGNSLLSPTRLSNDSLKRRPTRSNTVRHYHSPTRLKWEEPGAEPGVDTKTETETHNSLHQQCEITVVDFSDDRVEYHTLDNDNLEDFLKQPKEQWVQCRWINVNGLSWDVIRALGNHKGLHRLAIEDLMNTRGRTKVDWYSDQAFSTSTPFSPALHTQVPCWLTLSKCS